MQKNNYTEIMEKNHMEIPWHDYARKDNDILINNADLIEKASVIGRVGLIMLSCGTGAWRVRTSMNRLSQELGVTCTVDVGLMSIEFNCFDGNDCVSQSLSIANTGVNTSKLNRMEQFVNNFPMEEAHLTGEEIHNRPLLSHHTGISSSSRMLCIHISAWRWIGRNGSCLYCSRHRKPGPHQVDQTSLYLIFKYRNVNFSSMSGLRTMP